ncbi:MAG: glycosyltransferase, partial [Dokdonella sp.]
LLVRTLVQRQLGVEALGHFQAAWAISMTYIGFVLTAMSTDYYPRLTAAIRDHAAVNRMVNEQTEIVLLLAGPVFVAMIGLAPWVIELLYSSRFAEAATILRWQVLGDILKVASWPLGFIILAAGDGRTFVLTESLSIATFAILTWLGLPILGIKATGIAFLGMYVVLLPVVYWIARSKTGFAWQRRVSMQLITLTGLALAVFLASVWSKWFGAGLGTVAAAGLALHGLARLGHLVNLGGPLGRVAASSRRALIKTESGVTDTERPLVTFALFAYNQSQYVREAIAGAFSQDYSPLEIILSDDCSTDDTFEVMQHAAEEYRGPHAIKLNRNPRNLNIGGHVNVVNRLAGGELIVLAAGDDISMPDRVSRIVNAWLEGNKQAGVLHSNCRVITATAEIVDFVRGSLASLESAEAAAVNNPAVVGPTVTWDRRMFDFFGDLRSDLVHEDCALPFRSLLAGRPVVFIEQPLVFYRAGVGISSVFGGAGPRLDAAQRIKLLALLRIDALQKLDDLDKKPDPTLKRILSEVMHRYDVAILFESGVPGLKQWVACVRKAGFLYVIRMTAKRIVNRWRDSQ